jgi:hypothetical protein
MSLQSVDQLCFSFFPSRDIDLELSSAPLTSDAGLLVLREFDERIGLTRQFATALQDLRAPRFCDHSLLEMVRQRVYGILADYEDQNDHDTLRSDPVFKLLADRLPDADDLASQPTLSRFENAVTPDDLFRLRDVFIDLFIQSFETPPLHLTLDLDPFDDPTHGQQQLTFFHGYYDQYQYLPLAVTCAENEAVVMVGLRFGTCAAYLGADDDLKYLVGRLRQVWPDVQIHVRGDCGLGVPLMYQTCDDLRVQFTFGLGMNAVLKRFSADLLAQAEAQYEATRQPQRLFMKREYQARTWATPRQIVIKAEAHAQGTNRRAVITNRAGWEVLPQAVYDEYTERGEGENRNKELKCEMLCDRLSDHRFMANFFRLYLHTAALTLLVRLRRAVACPPTTGMERGPEGPLPTAALAEPQRKKYFNRRRRDDPLGEGQACTWRTQIIKVAAEIITRARRIIVRLSASWPHLDQLLRVGKAIAALPSLPSG